MKPLFQFRRLRYGALAVLVLSLLLAAPQVLAQQRQSLVDGVDAIGITVSDMDRAVDFYSRVLYVRKGIGCRSGRRRVRTRHWCLRAAHPDCENEAGRRVH